MNMIEMRFRQKYKHLRFDCLKHIPLSHSKPGSEYKAPPARAIMIPSMDDEVMLVPRKIALKHMVANFVELPNTSKPVADND